MTVQAVITSSTCGKEPRLRKLDLKRINYFEMKSYRKILHIPWIALRVISSILNELHLPTNWLYNFVRLQKLKYFGQVTRHGGLEKTIMQGMVAGKRSRGKPIQRWEKDITYTFGTMAAASRVAEDRHQFRRHMHLTRKCSEKKKRVRWKYGLWLPCRTILTICIDASWPSLREAR